MRFLVVAALFTAAPALAEPGILELRMGYGTPDRIVLGGRLIENEGVRAPAVHRTATDNLIDAYRTLETDEIVGARLEVRVGSRRFEAVTDDDGNFLLDVFVAPALPVGEQRWAVHVLDDRGHPTPDADAPLRVLPDGGVLLVSDFDDTVVQSHVRDKARLLAGALLKNAAQLTPVPGVGAAYRAARSAGARSIFYLSGSPQSFHGRVNEFLRIHELPPGPVLLKNFGSEELFDQRGYKTRRLEALLDLFGHARFVLVGDSGEHDPEIYREVAARHPGRVAGIVIRRVEGDESSAKRLEGMQVVADYAGAPDVISTLVRDRSPRPAEGPR
jgi:phosphatidate phosphatase APP1